MRRICELSRALPTLHGEASCVTGQLTTQHGPYTAATPTGSRAAAGPPAVPSRGETRAANMTQGSERVNRNNASRQTSRGRVPLPEESPMPERPLPTEQEVRALIKSRRNWARWGQDDQLGAINLITPAKRAAAARLVRSGRSVSLSRPFPKEPGPNNAMPAQH